MAVASSVEPEWSGRQQGRLFVEAMNDHLWESHPQMRSKPIVGLHQSHLPAYKGGRFDMNPQICQFAVGTIRCQMGFHVFCRVGMIIRNSLVPHAVYPHRRINEMIFAPLAQPKHQMGYALDGSNDGLVAK